MRNLRDLLRHYNVVNSRDPPQHPIRFGALLFLAVSGAVVLIVAAMSGPDPVSVRDVASSDETGGDGRADLPGVAAAQPASGIVEQRTEDGWYVGYLEGTPTADIDPAALDIALAAWLKGHPGYSAEPVVRDGIVSGYALRPLA